jgi:hypothetical protein
LSFGKLLNNVLLGFSGKWELSKTSEKIKHLLKKYHTVKKENLFKLKIKIPFSYITEKKEKNFPSSLLMHSFNF